MDGSASRVRALCDELLRRACDEQSQTSYAEAVDCLMAFDGRAAAFEQLQHLRTRLRANGTMGEEDARDITLLDRAIANFHKIAN